MSNAFANKQAPQKRLEYNNERCFLRGPYQGVFSGTSLEFSQF
jgi:hypothetical protein